MILRRRRCSFLVLVNGEEQHRLWPAFADLPTASGLFRGKRTAVCLEYIEENRTDIRPKSLRERLAEGRAFDA